MSLAPVAPDKSVLPEKAGAETPTTLLGAKSMRQSSLTGHNSDAEKSVRGGSSKPQRDIKNDKRYRDAEWLREQYVEKKRSTTEIAEECGCSSNCVRTWLKKHGIETRSSGLRTPEKLKDEAWLREQYVECKKSTVEIADQCDCSDQAVLSWLDNHDIETREAGWKTPDELKEKSWLREQYVEKKRSTTEIAEECGCSSNCVSEWLKRHGIKTRSGGLDTPEMLKDEAWLREQYVECKKSSAEIADQCDCSDQAVLSWLDNHDIETREGGHATPERLKNRRWLHEQYVEKGRSSYDIAERCDCVGSTVLDWLDHHNIDRRRMVGEDHPQWKGGQAIYGPGWGEPKRRKVRKRDEHQCQGCGESQDTHTEKYDEKLHVHHLIKARDIDDPEERNAMENLITLCRDCHQEWERVADAGIRPQIDGVTAD